MWVNGLADQLEHNGAALDPDFAAGGSLVSGTNPAGIDGNQVDTATLCPQMKTIAGVDETRQRSEGEEGDEGFQ